MAILLSIHIFELDFIQECIIVKCNILYNEEKQLMIVGETFFHKSQRIEHYNHFMAHSKWQTAFDVGYFQKTLTVPDRSNLTGNALLERKWDRKWNAAGTPKERQNFCGVGARSIENDKFRISPFA